MPTVWSAVFLLPNGTSVSDTSMAVAWPFPRERSENRSHIRMATTTLLPLMHRNCPQEEDTNTIALVARMVMHHATLLSREILSKEVGSEVTRRQ